MNTSQPPPIQQCTYPDHPARRHGHYGRGPYWCADLRSPLLGEANGGHVHRGWILVFEKGADQ